MKVLFIGGTGNISTPCTRLLLAQGHRVSLLNRGTAAVKFPEGDAESLQCDTEIPGALEQAVEGKTWDAVVNWIAYRPEQVERDIRLFTGRTSQYIFISTASAYRKPPLNLVIRESTPLHNTYWDYSALKITCEERLISAWKESSFPAAIVRPSHTYGEQWLPSSFGSQDYTVTNRIIQGKPVAVHGDGQSIWTLTHAEDFAGYFVHVVGNPLTAGEAYHITSGESLTWDMIHRLQAEALGKEIEIIHLPVEFIARHAPDMAPGLLGDKAWSVVFDTSKIEALAGGFRPQIPFSRGIRKSLAWYENNPHKIQIDAVKDRMIDMLIEKYEKAMSS